MRMRNKTVSESTVEKRKNVSEKNIKLLQGKIRRLENEQHVDKNLIESLIAQQQT